MAKTIGLVFPAESAPKKVKPEKADDKGKKNDKSAAVETATVPEAPEKPEAE